MEIASAVAHILFFERVSPFLALPCSLHSERSLSGRCQERQHCLVLLRPAHCCDMTTIPTQSCQCESHGHCRQFALDVVTQIPVGHMLFASVANAQMALVASTRDRSHPCSVPTASVQPAMPASHLTKTSDESVSKLVGNARELYRYGTPHLAAVFPADSQGAQRPCRPHSRSFGSPIAHQPSTRSTMFTLFHDRERSSSVQRGDPARGRPRSIPLTMVSRPSCQPTSLNCLHHGSPRPNNQ